jgi:hypothetical protein
MTKIRPTPLEEPEHAQPLVNTREQQEAAAMAALSQAAESSSSVLDKLFSNAAATLGPPTPAPTPAASEPAASEPGARDTTDLTVTVDPLDTIEYLGTSYDNKEVRKRLEAGLGKLDLSDLIYSGSITQAVPVLNGSLVATYRSLTRANTISLQRYISTQYKNFAEQSELEFRDFTRSARIGVILVSVKSNASRPSPLTRICDCVLNNGDIDHAALTANVEILRGNIPEILYEVLSTNGRWFEHRVALLLSGDTDFLSRG